jgi:hypothetical protein
MTLEDLTAANYHPDFPIEEPSLLNQAPLVKQPIL